MEGFQARRRMPSSRPSGISLTQSMTSSWCLSPKSSATCFSAPSATCWSRINTEPNDASPSYCDTIVAFGCRISLRWSDAGGWDLSFKEGEVIGVVHSSVPNFNQSHLQEAPNAVEKVPITRWWLWGCLALNLVHGRRCSQTRWSNQMSRHPWGATRMHLRLSRNPLLLHEMDLLCSSGTSSFHPKDKTQLLACCTTSLRKSQANAVIWLNFWELSRILI